MRNLLKGTFLGATMLCAATLHATEYTWSGNATGAWNDPANWGGSGYPSTSEDTAKFPAGSYIVTGVGASEVYSIKKMTFTKGGNGIINAVTFKDLHTAWYEAPSFVSSNRIEFVDSAFGGASGASGRPYRASCSGVVGLELVFAGTWKVPASHNKFRWTSVGDGTSFMFSDGADADLSFYGNGGGNVCTLGKNVVATVVDLTIPSFSRFSFASGAQLVHAVSFKAARELVADIALTVNDEEKAGGNAKFSVDGKYNMDFSAGMTLNVDLANVPFGTYPIIHHKTSKADYKFTVPDATAANLGFGLNLVNAEGKAASLQLVKSGFSSTVNLVVVSGGFVENDWVTPPSVTPSAWYVDNPQKGVLTNGVPLKGESVATTNGVAITQADVDAFPIGEYRVDFTVPAKESEYTGLATSIVVRVLRHQNRWTVPPSVGKIVWAPGESVEIANGTPAFGVSVITTNGVAIAEPVDTTTWGIGMYDLAFTVVGATAYTGLQTNVIVKVTEGGEVANTTYTWKSDVAAGAWESADNWTGDGRGVRGYPSDILAVAKFTAGDYVVSGGGTSNQVATVLQDPLTTLTLSNVTIAATNGIETAAGGVLRLDAAELVHNGQSRSSRYFYVGGSDDFPFGRLELVNGSTIAAEVVIGNCSNPQMFVAGGTNTVWGPLNWGGGKRVDRDNFVTVSNAVLSVGTDSRDDFEFGNDHPLGEALPTLRLMDAQVICTGMFVMNSPATNELWLAKKDRNEPRIYARGMSLSNMVFKVRAAEPGTYLLAETRKTPIKLPNGTTDGLAVDTSAMAMSGCWTSKFILSEDGMRLSLKLGRIGMMVIVR